MAIEVEWQRRSQSAHPDDWFAWPDTSGGNGKLVLKPSVSDGMLSYLDYRVGRNGEVGSIRYGILVRVFEGPLPPGLYVFLGYAEVRCPLTQACGVDRSFQQKRKASARFHDG
jgi:hypothetical protein